MASKSNTSTHENATLTPDVNGREPHSVEKTDDDKSKTPRHPRWTRQETLVLIEGKNMAEERGRKGRRSSSVFGLDQLEPKWDAVSSHCRQNGVNRGPVQCRKRWSNLICDFKKIKAWDSEVQNGEYFWAMRSDMRREKKLPGFFDREVYDVLDGNTLEGAACQLALVTTSAGESIGYGLDDVEAEDVDDIVEGEETEDDLISENGRSTGKANPKDGKREKIPSPVPISEIRYQTFHQAYPNQGTENKRRQGLCFCGASASQEGAKRRRETPSDCQNTDADDKLIKALERNTTLLNEQLEAQKLNSQMDREQQKDQHNSLLTALNKITDTLEKIANKM